MDGTKILNLKKLDVRVCGLNCCGPQYNIHPPINLFVHLINFVFCPSIDPEPLPKRVLYGVRSSSSTLNSQYQFTVSSLLLKFVRYVISNVLFPIFP
jgi:hypothetical protein